MPTGKRSSDVESITEALLVASRALLGVAVASLGSVTDDVTLPQFRALVVLSSRGPQTVGGLAEFLGVHPSTATRLVDRLHRKGLATRRPTGDDRRMIEVSLSESGRAIVDQVTARRRTRIARIVERIPERERAGLVRALHHFSDAADEPAVAASDLGWAP
jgi:DNA-binding MarR family transcriptional regulator